MAIEDRGFASMDPSKQREIASRGGRAAHIKGTAHEWSCDEAREAGRKGGFASQRRKHAAPQEAAENHTVERRNPEASPRQDWPSDF
jgi:general stress protein YciG